MGFNPLIQPEDLGVPSVIKVHSILKEDCQVGIRDSSQLISGLLCGLYLVMFRGAESHPKWTGFAMLPRHFPPWLFMKILYSANEHSKLSLSTQLWNQEFGFAAPAKVAHPHQALPSQD